MPRLESDFLEVINAAANSRLAGHVLEWSDLVAVDVVLASPGYPESPETGLAIIGVDKVSEAIVFHAGTTRTASGLITSGGRVINVVGISDTFAEGPRRRVLGFGPDPIQRYPAPHRHSGDRRRETNVKVAILMGSVKDMPKMEACTAVLDTFGIEYEVHVMSAHRTPEIVAHFAANARKDGFGAIICGCRQSRPSCWRRGCSIDTTRYWVSQSPLAVSAEWTLCTQLCKCQLVYRWLP